MWPPCASVPCDTHLQGVPQCAGTSSCAMYQSIWAPGDALVIQGIITDQLSVTLPQRQGAQPSQGCDTAYDKGQLQLTGVAASPVISGCCEGCSHAR